MIADVIVTDAEAENKTPKGQGMEVAIEVSEYSCICDKVMIGLGIFVFLCVLCIILLFTVPRLYYDNTTITNTTITNTTTVMRRTRPTIYGNYNMTNSNIYFTGNSRIQFAEHTKMNVLIVGGGGGASYGGGWITGGSGTGGGGGGCVGEGMLQFTANVAYDITIGNGGRMNRNKFAEKGGNTKIFGDDINEMAEGGGYGGYYVYNSIGGGSYGYSGLMTSGEIIYNFTNTYLGQSVQGSGTLTYHSHSGGEGLNNGNKNPGSGGGGAGGPGNRPGGEYEGGKGGTCYIWKINNECYGSGGDGGSTIEQNATKPLSNTGGGGHGASTNGPQTSSSGSSGIVILSYFENANPYIPPPVLAIP
jgi:hypothetical protein